MLCKILVTNFFCQICPVPICIQMQ
ncbi:MAG: hypothetical protein E7063_03290, partial [Spirochaetaceae bacterium]|nr:hypothetical protein [Spirochaetaceae bacterium]